MTDCMTATLTVQGGGESGSRATVSGNGSPYGEPVSWKDPL
jgi:hypothetical protein